MERLKAETESLLPTTPKRKASSGTEYQPPPKQGSKRGRGPNASGDEEATSRLRLPGRVADAGAAPSLESFMQAAAAGRQQQEAERWEWTSPTTALRAHSWLRTPTPATLVFSDGATASRAVGVPAGTVFLVPNLQGPGARRGAAPEERDAGPGLLEPWYVPAQVGYAEFEKIRGMFMGHLRADGTRGRPYPAKLQPGTYMRYLQQCFERERPHDRFLDTVYVLPLLRRFISSCQTTDVMPSLRLCYEATKTFNLPSLFGAHVPITLPTLYNFFPPSSASVNVESSEFYRMAG